MDTKAKDLFERNPEVDTLYKVKNKSIYFTSKEGAGHHVDGDLSQLDTVKRSDFHESEAEDTPPDPLFPDGDPAGSWKKDEIRAWMDENEVAYEKMDVKKVLLEKVAKHLNPDE